MNKTIASGLRLAVFNFFLVAVVGSIMRLKSIFNLSIFEFKNLVNAHSHFAFYGWITAILYLLIVSFLHAHLPQLNFKKYVVLVVLNFLGSYGMLLSFTYNDYYWLSITFSTLNLFCSWLFFLFYYIDTKKQNLSFSEWHLAGLFFAFISSFGIFYIGYQTATKQITPVTLQASVLYYLHFQYNGFFIFSSLGLFLQLLKKHSIQLPQNVHHIIFKAFFLSCLLGYGLSIIWIELPTWIYGISIIAILVQSIGIIIFLKFILQHRRSIINIFNKLQTFILLYVGIAFIIKSFLQLISVIPLFSRWIIEYRSITIAYLHLILLVGISTFLLSNLTQYTVFKFTQQVKIQFKVFLLLVFLNQCFLVLDIIEDVYHRQLYASELLAITGLLISFCLLSIVSALRFDTDRN